MTTATALHKAEKLFPNCETSDWYRNEMPENAGFDRLFEAFIFRKTAPGKVEVILETGKNSANLQDGIHGGFLAARIEQMLYLPLYVNRSVQLGRVVIVDFELKYLSGGKLGSPLTVDIELIHETGRLGFTRGLVKQGENSLVAFSATIRKFESR